MKSLLLTIILGISSSLACAQTATNFNCADCKGIQHDLFSELDSGYVIVLDWVMPCAACVGPSLTTYNVVQSFQATHPGRVRMYLCDDYANTSCTALNSWRNNQGMPDATTFSNAAISMNDYGGNGMPKVVVLGGTGHAVHYTGDFTVNATAMQQAIVNALAAVNGIGEAKLRSIPMAIMPNPAREQATISFQLAAPAKAELQLHDLTGKLVWRATTGSLPIGPQRMEIPTAQLPEGTYFLRLSTGTTSTTSRLLVAH